MFGLRYRDDLQTGQMSAEGGEGGELAEVGWRRRVRIWAWSSPSSSPGRRGAAPLRAGTRDMAERMDEVCCRRKEVQVTVFDMPCRADRLALVLP